MELARRKLAHHDRGRSLRGVGRGMVRTHHASDNAVPITRILPWRRPVAHAHATEGDPLLAGRTRPDPPLVAAESRGCRICHLESRSAPGTGTDADWGPLRSAVHPRPRPSSKPASSSCAKRPSARGRSSPSPCSASAMLYFRISDRDCPELVGRHAPLGRGLTRPPSRKRRQREVHQRPRATRSRCWEPARASTSHPPRRPPTAAPASLVNQPPLAARENFAFAPYWTLAAVIDLQASPACPRWPTSPST